MSLTAEQLLARRAGITGTDAPKITGVSPWGGPIDVLLDKRDVSAPFTETDRVKWGNILEEPIRQDFARRHQLDVTVPGTLQAEGEDAWMIATPDGILWDRGRPVAGLEIKTHTNWVADQYGEEGTDEIPADKMVQNAWNLAVARRRISMEITTWHHVAFFDGLPHDYVIHHDQELEDMLRDVCGQFWFQHVVGGAELEPDGTEAFTRHLARMFPDSVGEMIEADSETIENIEGLRNVRAEIRDKEKAEERLVQCIKQAIGDDQGLIYPEGKITWRKSKDSSRTDWKACAQEWRNALELVADPEITKGLDDTVQRYTTTKPGSRRFVVPRNWNS